LLQRTDDYATPPRSSKCGVETNAGTCCNNQIPERARLKGNGHQTALNRP